MLCLTVYEAKGLEFDDVILFNFFEDSKCGNQWMLMKDIDYVMKVVKKYKDFDFIDFEHLNVHEQEEEEFDSSEERKCENEEDDDKKKIKTVMVSDDEEVSIELKLKKERSLVYR